MKKNYVCKPRKMKSGGFLKDVGNFLLKNQIPSLAATALGGPLAGAGVGLLQNTLLPNGIDPEEQIPIMRNGGKLDKHLINVENKELLTDPEGNILKEYKNKPLHPKKGINSLGNTVEDGGNFIIPRKLADPFKNGDKLRRNSILMELSKNTDTSLFMKKGGKIPKFDGETNGSFIPLKTTWFPGEDSIDPSFRPSDIPLIKTKTQGLLNTSKTDLQPVLGGTGRTGYSPAFQGQKKPLMGPKTANTLFDIGSLAINNLGPASYLLSQGKKYDKVNYGQVTPEFLNPNEELLGAEMENAQLNQDIKNYSGGNSGTYLANRQAGSSRNLLNRNKIIRDYANTNAGISNQFKQYNKSLEMKSMDDTARNKGAAISNYFAALSNLGANTAQGLGDIKERKMQEKRLNLYKDIFPNYDFDPVNYTFTKKQK